MKHWKNEISFYISFVLPFRQWAVRGTKTGSIAFTALFQRFLSCCGGYFHTQGILIITRIFWSCISLCFSGSGTSLAGTIILFSFCKPVIAGIQEPAIRPGYVFNKRVKGCRSTRMGHFPFDIGNFIKNVVGRIRTCAGKPSRFLVCLLNHSDTTTFYLLSF